MQKKLNWQGYSNQERNKAIEEIKNAISSNDGYIVNFNMFSDLAMSLSVGIDENCILDLHLALQGLLTISDIDRGLINQHSKKEWLIFMNISFSKGKGDLKIDVPEVPG